MPTARKPQAPAVAQDPPEEAPEGTTEEATEPEEVLLGHADFTTDTSHSIPMAGLLASDPDLRTAKLPESEWQARFDQYMTSERP